MIFPQTTLYRVLIRIVSPIFAPVAPTRYDYSTTNGNGYVLFVSSFDGGGGTSPSDEKEGDQEALGDNAQEKSDGSGSVFNVLAVITLRNLMCMIKILMKRCAILLAPNVSILANLFDNGNILLEPI